MMKLYYTPKSHFARKNLILIHAWDIDVELIDVGNVAVSESFGGNPMMKVPTLVFDRQWVIGSDNISQYLVRKYDLEDKFDVLTADVNALNAREILNGIMSSEVEIILAQRSGLDTNSLKRFDKMTDSIISGLDWLEQNASLFSEKPNYLNFHLVCMWDHLALYTTVNLTYPKLQEYVDKLYEIPYVSKSVPLA